MLRLLTALCLSLALLSACADNRRNLAMDVATNAHLTGAWVPAGSTRLMTWHRINQPGTDLTVYIEGDGFAYATRDHVSPDPTPRTPMVLRLTAQNPAGNVAYLARPCMYFDPEHPVSECQNSLWWTTGRFSEAVVTAMDQGLDHLKQMAGAPRLHLIGFSGGGAIAALLAARRPDVASLRTLAGNLDHEAFTRFHQVTPLMDSLNPLQVAPQLVHMPQIHFIGSEDPIIPAQVTRNFMAALGDARCAQVITVPGVQHDDGWLAVWPKLLDLQPQCTTPR
ncbi:MAG: alpha/beta hydrolase [Magnetococcales bacterium]|nr:alpha/beta hydrolase [Magnetococcales bacterium]